MTSKLLKIGLIALPLIVPMIVFAIINTIEGEESLHLEPMTKEQKNSIENKLRPFLGIIIFSLSVGVSIILWKKQSKKLK